MGNSQLWPGLSRLDARRNIGVHRLQRLCAKRDQPPLVDGLGVEGDLNKTQVTCARPGQSMIRVDLQLSRPIAETGPCAGNFGVVMDISVGDKTPVRERELVGYCGVAVLKSVKITSRHAEMCTLAKADDPDRNDPVNTLPPVNECSSVSVK